MDSTGRDNNIGVLRLLLASLVIVGHAPEMTDGDRLHEPLTMIFRTLSLGDLSVDAFFLLSGYLITMSMDRSATIEVFLRKRIRRIVPAYVIAFLASALILGTVVGAKPWDYPRETLFYLLTLQTTPNYPGQLPGLHVYASLNGSLWTIGYEFRCYLLVALLSRSGVLHRRAVVAGVTVILLMFSVADTFDPFRGWLKTTADGWLIAQFGASPSRMIRLLPIFMVGMCCYLFRGAASKVWSSKPAAVACGLLTALLMYRDPHLAELGVATFGAMVLFWLAFAARLGPLRQINLHWDISYGVYLYGWPIATFIRWLDPAISPWTLAAATLPLAFGAGAASWWGVEKPVSGRPLASQPSSMRADAAGMKAVV